jgi:catechol 2,3-dioxygenase-like lactoylglutathione lyase family enzyme
MTPRIKRRQIAARPDASIPPIERLHHYGYRCADAEVTRHFYEDILGLPLARVVSHDHIPSTGEYAPYCHIFFELGDGSYIAFFDIFDGKGSVLADDVPDWLHHIALMVESEKALLDMKARLESRGLEVLGPITHSVMSSIYFWDPNGHRLELVWEHDVSAILQGDAEIAHQKLKDVLNKYVPGRAPRVTV